MRTVVALFLALALGAAAQAAPPEPAVFVTDQNEDVYVALYGDRAVELSGCSGAEQVRALLQIDASVAMAETTLGALEAGFGFGARPRIPCAGVAFDQDWPATTPIWADVAGSGNYYLPGAAGGYVAVPARCEAIKTALAIRERLQLPGVLKAMAPPPDLGEAALVLDCGEAVPDGPDVVAGQGGSARWSLHRFETFLSETSTGDTVLVARFMPAGEGAVPAYLPIWRIDGAEVAPMALEAGGLASAEASVKALLGIEADAAVGGLGAEAVPALRSAVYADLCTTACTGYAHVHAAFLQPGIDLGVSELPPAPVAAAIDRLGNEQVVWPFTEGRLLQFTGCPALSLALGLVAPALGDWMAATGAAVSAEVPPGSAFDCRASAAATCTRIVGEGLPLTVERFAPGPDCAGARRLRVEIQALTETAGALSIAGSSFEAVTIAPVEGLARATLRATPGRLPASSTGCVLSATDAIFAANNIARVEFERIDIQRKAGTGSGDVLALQVQGGALVLSSTTLGSDPEGAEPVSRGINLCLADLYASGSRIDAQSLALQGLSARVLFAGTPAARATVARARFGLLLSADSQARLDNVDLTAGTPVVLRGGVLKGASVALAPLSTLTPAGSALQLERGATAEFLTSTAAGFRCAASFADAASSVSFVLPGNDIAAANVNLACGNGQVHLIE